MRMDRAYISILTFFFASCFLTIIVTCACSHSYTLENLSLSIHTYTKTIPVIMYLRIPQGSWPWGNTWGLGWCQNKGGWSGKLRRVSAGLGGWSARDSGWRPVMGEDGGGRPGTPGDGASDVSWFQPSRYRRSKRRTIVPYSPSGPYPAGRSPS